MAKGTSGRGSATGTPSSLTSLLALTQPSPVVSPLDDAVIVNQLNHGNYYGPQPQSDRRRYDPTIRSRSPHALIRSATRLHIASVGTATGRLSAHIEFSEPRKVDLCIRRHTRRSVLFARKLTSKGSGSKSRRRNFFSDVKC